MFHGVLGKFLGTLCPMRPSSALQFVSPQSLCLLYLLCLLSSPLPNLY